MTPIDTFLTPPQWDTLEALVNRIIPADEWPGGWEAGVGDYLRRQFAADLAEKRALYQSGLDALDAEAQTALGHRFADAAPDAQDELLTRIEAGIVTTPWFVRPAYFFQQAISHSMEGFYADPGNGGNHNGVSWDMIGFEVTA